MITIHAQKDPVDSLLKLTTSTVDTVKSKALVNLAMHLARKHDSTAFTYAKELLKLAKSSTNKRIETEAYLAMATCLDYNSEYLDAVDYYAKGLVIAEELGIVDYILRCGMGEAVILKEKGDYQNAIQLFYHLLEISEAEDNLEGKIIALSNIANIYTNKSEFGKALDIQLEVLAIDSSLNDEYGMSIDYNNIGNIYFNTNRQDSAYIYFSKAYQIKKRIGDVYGASISTSNIGKCFLDLGKLDSAYFYINQSIIAREEMNDVLGLAWSYMYLGEYYTELGDLKKAENSFTKALSYSEEMESLSNISEIYKEQSEMYAKFGRYQDAYIYVLKYHDIKDTLLSEEAIKDMANLEFKYQTEKKILEIENLKKDQAITDAKLKNEQEINKQKTRQQYLAYAAVAFFLLFGVASLIGFIRKRKDNKIISEQKSEVEHQKNEIELQKHMLQEKNQEIIDSINYAKRIQSAILPSPKAFEELLPEAFVLYQPKDILAGDFYWLETTDDSVLFAAADCTGHGVPGAMVSVICNNSLNKSVKEHFLHEPNLILDKTRELVINEFSKSEEKVKDGMDIALCKLTKKGGEYHLSYSGANNPLWIVRKGTGLIEEVKANKQPIGNSESPTPFDIFKTTLDKGDAIYIFSDGYADQFGGEKGKKFKASSFKELLIEIQEFDLKIQKQKIHQNFEDWKGSLEQLDDVCVIGVRI
ncbi:MAG: SpoIIE family protein phosphatase [Flavobacteriales bacterium]|nr:SpoIIE family protein phosphatase [Flavobacteriales bacterium]MCB9197240.1 SpoIIE family protein phosphatase [Flavobacteriales bacterium]